MSGKERTILGHIDCPHCGTAKGMRVTPDRNGSPFGYCEAECGGQLRVGGDPRRVAAFYRKHPHVKVHGAPAAPAAPAAAAAPAAPAVRTETHKQPAPKDANTAPARAGAFDFLLNGGTRK